MNPKIVSERLGHHSVAFTLDTYAHVIPGMQSEAIRRLADLVEGTAGELPHQPGRDVSNP